MEKMLADLARAHDLHCVSVMYSATAKIEHITVYAHPNDLGGCESGTAKTFREAFAEAVAKLVARRVVVAEYHADLEADLTQ